MLRGDKERISMLRIPLLRLRGVRGVMRERIFVLRRDVAGHSPNFKMELTEKLNYYEQAYG